MKNLATLLCNRICAVRPKQKPFICITRHNIRVSCEQTFRATFQTRQLGSTFFLHHCPSCINCINWAHIKQTCINLAIINRTCINWAHIYQICINLAIINRTCINRTCINHTCINRALINCTCINRAIINRTCINRAIINRTCINRAIINRTCINRACRWSI
jgi:hypothetical protein